MKLVRIKLGFLKSNFFIFLYFAVLTLVWTYPIVTSLNSRLLGYHDAWQFTWNFWWVKKALLELHVNPLYTNYIHWPNGISLLFHTLNLSNSLIAIPLQYLFNLTTTYNLLALFNLSFNGFATYLLAYYLNKNKLASFVAGYIVAFSPYIFAHALGHLNLISFGWLVLAILYFTKMVNGESKWYWPGLLIVITGLTDWYYFLFLFMFIGLYLIFLLIQNRKIYLDKIFLKNLLLTIFLSILVLLPYLGSMIYLKVKSVDFDEIVHRSIDYSVDLSALFIPNAPSYYFLDHFYRFWRKWHWTWEGIGYLGYTILLLTGYAIVKIKNHRKIILFWAFSAFLFLILALGPYLQINGEIYKKIILPYYFFEKLPLMSIQGTPARFMIMVYLALAIIVGFAISDLDLLKTKLRYLIIGLILVFIVLEYLPKKLVISPISIPDYYQTLKSENGDFAIMDVSTEESLAMFYQTIHRKRLIGGYTSRPSKKTTDFLEQVPVVSNIYQGIDKPELSENVEKNKNILKEYQIKYIIINSKDKKNKIINQNRQSILEKLQLPIIWQKSGIIVYGVY